eukprot:TRINITY_DN172_c0_g1_i3.p1 TRINITY_DN172_c0_g1~~TRINITY_DN172_c0_g1_i3.p1  ORF type:complete len:289 (-),score=106.05 TRINITY_DN172_c0_g1_i3:633-1499(-)
MEDQRSVFVSNISPSATEKTVSDFFSFCGRITRLTLKRDPSADGAQEAVVVFETDSAAKTALLLTNALIVDRPITVVPHASSGAEHADASAPPAPAAAAEHSGENLTQRAHSVPDHERTKTSVIASLIAAGYQVGSDAIDKAREVDEKHSISLQLKVGAEQVKAKANEIDAKLHITETAATIKTVAVEKAHQVDEQLGITSKATVAAAVAKGAAGAVVAQVSSNETVAKGLTALKSVASSVTSAVTGQYQEVKTETERAIEEKKAEKAASAPSTTTTTSDAPAPSTTH